MCRKTKLVWDHAIYLSETVAGMGYGFGFGVTSVRSSASETHPGPWKSVPRKCGHFPVPKTNARDGHPLWVPVSSLQKWDRNMAPPLGTRLSLIPSPASELFLGRCPPVFPGRGPVSQPDPTANQNSISTNDKVVRFTATEPEDMTHPVPAG